GLSWSGEILWACAAAASFMCRTARSLFSAVTGTSYRFFGCTDCRSQPGKDAHVKPTRGLRVLNPFEKLRSQFSVSLRSLRSLAAIRGCRPSTLHHPSSLNFFPLAAAVPIVHILRQSQPRALISAFCEALEYG